MTLPSWVEAEDRVLNGLATPLDTFIYNHEPLGDDSGWREQLKAVFKPSDESRSYLISFSSRTGISRFMVQHKGPISSVEDVLEIEKRLNEDHPHFAPHGILSFQELK